MSEETALQPRIKTSWLVGTLAAFALFLAIGAYSSRMARDYTGYDEERAAKRYDTLAKLQQDENKLIDPVDAHGHATAEWVDQTKGIIRIPIEEAMVKEVDTLKSQPAAMGALLTVTAPAPAPAAGATNVAPITPAAPAGATNAAPAKPAKPAKPVKSAFLSPDRSNQPIFKTHRIDTRVIIRDGSDGLFVMGGLIKDKEDAVDIRATPEANAATPPPAKPNS